MSVAGEKHQQRVVHCCSSRLHHYKQFLCFSLALNVIHCVPKSTLIIMFICPEKKIRAPRPVQRLCDTVSRELPDYLVNYLLNSPVNYLVQPHQEEGDA